MENLNLSIDIIQLIKDFMPRDKDMRHPTALLFENPIGWWRVFNYYSLSFDNVNPGSFAMFMSSNRVHSWTDYPKIKKVQIWAETC